MLTYALFLSILIFLQAIFVNPHFSVKNDSSPCRPGEINCALTLLCQMIGNIIAFIGATSQVRVLKTQHQTWVV